VSLLVDRLELGPFATNCYLVRRDRSVAEAVVIDPSGSAAEIRLRLAATGARCGAIVVTHGHFDHLLGLADLAEGTGVTVYGPKGDLAALEAPSSNAMPGLTIRPYTPEVLLAGGETIEACGISFDVRHVPGHSPGHLSFHADGCLFSGDVLFAGSVGRTDLAGGSWETLLASIRSLVEAYPGDTVVYPGHGPRTTLELELERNAFLAELRAERDAGAESG
jgi:glyoxylase-like metal-dependent hydrolase (beta-lactamase superfamily II)